MFDALSTALSQRRGNGLESSLFSPDTSSSESPSGVVEQNAPVGSPDVPDMLQSQVPEVQSPMAPPMPPQAALPQSPPTSGKMNEESEILDAMADHGTEREYSEMKGLKPRSLGERAKLEALKKKYDTK